MSCCKDFTSFLRFIGEVVMVQRDCQVSENTRHTEGDSMLCTQLVVQT